MTKRKIKVVFGVNDFLVGGMQRQFIEQLRFFNQDRFDITLITLFAFPEEQSLYDALPPGLSIHRFSFSGFGDVSSWFKLRRMLKELRPDIVVSNLFFANTVFRILQPFVGYISIACEHNTYIDKPYRHQLIDRLLAHLSYRIVAVSTTVANFTSRQEGIPRQKFQVIPNGIDIVQLQKRARILPAKDVLKRELGFDETNHVALTVGRLISQKNQKLLIDGFALFHETHRDWRLAIVGDGELRMELEAQAQTRGLAGAVTFFGLRHDVEKFYKASDVFVLTSDIEGFSLVCIEAMACGLPVISTKTAGPDEYVEDEVNGLLIETGTAPAVARGLEDLLEGDMERLHAGALRTAEHYTIAASVKCYEQLFEESVKHRKAV